MKTNEFVNGVSKELLREMGVSGGGEKIRRLPDYGVGAADSPGRQICGNERAGAVRDMDHHPRI